MKQELRSRETVIIIGCDSGDLTAGSSLAPVLVVQQTGSDPHSLAHTRIYTQVHVYSCMHVPTHLQPIQGQKTCLFRIACLVCWAYTGGCSVHYTLKYETVKVSEERADI